MEDSSQTSSTISLQNVDDTVWGFARRQWWRMAIVIALAFIIGYFNLVLGFAVAFFGIYLLKIAYERSLFGAFASSNGFRFMKTGTLSDQTGFVFNLGNSRSYSDIITGTYEQWPFELFIYSYTVGYGKESQSYNRATMTINFSVALPSFVLLHGSLAGDLDNNLRDVKEAGYSVRVSLEGDFDKHLRLQVRPGSEIDVLSILSPDVLELLEGLDKYELEISDNGQFHVYTKNFITTKQELIDLYQIVGKIIPKIGNFANRQRTLHQRG